jgi:cell wall-associated NlpC family hydrolase
MGAPEDMHPHLVTADRAAVVAEALSWRGTPYHHHARVKGVGVDCAQLLIAAYAVAGVVLPSDPGHYPPEWHLHRSEERFLAHLQQAGARLVQAPAVGDVAVYRFGRCYSHGAVVVAPGLVVHAHMPRSGARGRVELCRTTDEPLAGRPVQYWSPWA